MSPSRRRSPITRDQILQVILVRFKNLKQILMKIYQVHTLKHSGITRCEIARQLNLSIYQVGHAVRTQDLTPKKRKGRKCKLSEEQVDELEAFIRSSRSSRHMAYVEIAAGPFRHWGVSEFVIQRALQRKGYSRCRAEAKPRLTEKTKNARKEWAEAHINWTLRDWSSILWTDETWATDGQCSGTFVTRMVGDITF